MPTKVDKIRLNENQDRRVKLTTKDKEKIVELYNMGTYSLQKLANKYGVSKKLILITVNPLSMEKSKNNSKMNWKKYQQSKEVRVKSNQKTRQYKRELLEKGELKEND